MHSSSSVLLIASFLAASSTYAQSTSTVEAVTQITDGQVQAPTVPAVSSYVNPYTTQTNSLGVVTGQPSPETSQPAPATSLPPLATSQESAATFYSSLPGVPVGINTTLVPIVSTTSGATATSTGNSSAGNLTTSTRTATGTRTSTERETSDPTGTPSSTESPESTGAAASLHIAVSGLALGVAGSFFALFL